MDNIDDTKGTENKKHAHEVIQDLKDKRELLLQSTVTVHPNLHHMQKHLDSTTAMMKLKGQGERLLDLTRPLNNLFETFSQFNLAKGPWFDFARFHEELITGFERYGKVTSEHLKKLSHYGWFLSLDFELRTPRELCELIESGNIEMVDEYFEDKIESQLQLLFEELSKHYPKRKEIFNQILKSYEIGMYYVTIPTIFSQIDGICMDLTERKFFIKNKSKGDKYRYLPEVVHAFEEINGSIIKAFVEPLFHNTPFNVNEDNIGEYPVNLNRHSILHGQDTNYGSKINCLKSLSLLFYISDVLLDVYNSKEG